MFRFLHCQLLLTLVYLVFSYADAETSRLYLVGERGEGEEGICNYLQLLFPHFHHLEFYISYPPQLYSSYTYTNTFNSSGHIQSNLFTEKMLTSATSLFRERIYIKRNQGFSFGLMVLITVYTRL